MLGEVINIFSSPENFQAPSDIWKLPAGRVLLDHVETDFSMSCSKSEWCQPQILVSTLSSYVQHNARSLTAIRPKRKIKRMQRGKVKSSPFERTNYK